MRFSPSAEFIATGSFKGKVRLYGVKDGAKKVSLDTAGKFALSHAFVSCCLKLGLQYDTSSCVAL